LFFKSQTGKTTANRKKNGAPIRSPPYTPRNETGLRGFRGPSTGPP